MSYRPLVSVVTPSLNQGAYIEQTILSVRRQSYPRVEHIVVDGGSTDATRDILRRHEGAYEMRWVSEPDGGMYEAVNKGLRMAHGDVLAYLNSDDRYFPWTVDTVIEALSRYPEAGFVFGDVFSIDEGAETGRVSFGPPFWLGHIRHWGFLAQPTVFWRRSVFDDCGGFDESLKFVADCDYWMRIGERHQGRKINEVLAIERNHPEAKRFAHTDPLFEELDEVRSRYVRMEGPGHRAHILADLAYVNLWHRYHLLRFLGAYFRRARLAKSGSDTAWAAFLTRNGDVRVFAVPALATLILPFKRGRFAQSMIRKDLTFLQQWDG